MLTELRRHRDRAPDTTAVHAVTPVGSASTSWTELYDDVLAVLAGAGELPAGAPVVVILDGSAAGIATLLGLSGAGLDVLLLEEQSSYLADPGSAVHRAECTTVVGPAGLGAAIPEPFTYLSYPDCRSAATTAPTTRRTEGDVLQLTSGSTGEPKLARQPFRNLLHGGHTYRLVFGLGESDAVLVPVPLAHSFGLVGGALAALAAGARLLTLGRFTIRQLVDLIESGATAMLGTPLVYQLLTPVLVTRRPTSRLRVALSSGSPLDADLAAAVRRALGVPVRQVYGSTETGLIAYQPESAGRWPDDAVGVAAPGVQVRIEPEPGGAAGAPGHLLVRTPTLFRGYLDPTDPGGADAPADGFYRTGDLATIDQHGLIRLAGRTSGFVNIGGRKVNPSRIERIIAEHPGVREVVVYGVADRGEEQVHAAVVLDASTRVADVMAFCRSRRLRPYEIPRRLHPLSRLPRTSMGKVDRRRVAAVAGQPAAVDPTRAEAR